MDARVFWMCLLLASCSLTKEQFDVVRNVPKDKRKAPPNTVWLKDNLFIDKTEIANIHYREFIYSTYVSNNKLYNAMLPDSTVWLMVGVNEESYSWNYFGYPALDYYPVVGVSYEQAVKFCEWRTTAVNLMEHMRRNRIHYRNIDTVKVVPDYVKFRLPTKDEWEYAALAGLEFKKFPLGYRQLTRRNIPIDNTLEYGNLFGSHRFVNAMSVEHEGLPYFERTPYAVYQSQPNAYGVHGTLGNVSELVLDTIVKGLNFITYLDGTTPLYDFVMPHVEVGNFYTIKTNYPYPGPRAWLGFRCICEVLL